MNDDQQHTLGLYITWAAIILFLGLALHGCSLQHEFRALRNAILLTGPR